VLVFLLELKLHVVRLIEKVSPTVQVHHVKGSNLMLKMLCDEDLPWIRDPIWAMAKVDCTRHQVEVVNELHVLIYRHICLDGNLSSPTPWHKLLLQGTLSGIVYDSYLLEQLLLLVPVFLLFD
jgi:hypothetical protein